MEDHNKSEHIYTFPNGSIVEFFSVDDEQKIRGRKRELFKLCFKKEKFISKCDFKNYTRFSKSRTILSTNFK